MKLEDNEISVLKLIERSKDIGDGYRKVSPTLWKGLIENFSRPELIEKLDGDKVRFSPKGLVIIEYL